MRKTEVEKLVKDFIENCPRNWRKPKEIIVYNDWENMIMDTFAPDKYITDIRAAKNEIRRLKKEQLKEKNKNLKKDKKSKFIYYPIMSGLAKNYGIRFIKNGKCPVGMTFFLSTNFIPFAQYKDRKYVRVAFTPSIALFAPYIKNTTHLLMVLLHEMGHVQDKTYDMGDPSFLDAYKNLNNEEITFLGEGRAEAFLGNNFKMLYKKLKNKWKLLKPIIK